MIPRRSSAALPARSHQLLAFAASLLVAPAARAQHDHDARPPTVSVMATATLVGTRVDPAIFGTTLTEGYLAQPMVMVRSSWPGPRVDARVTVNLEGLTLRRGELGPGIHGEGYIDRRHPHTYLHEAMLSWQTLVRHHGLSLAAGKGFVPYGSDDPMSRPFEKFPVNHHLAQLLERAQVVGAVRRAWLQLEGAVFNGDEPERPADWPNAARFGDSWAARATLRPARDWEVSGSVASVASPEDARGQGLDQTKRHASVRWERPSRATGVHYALLEYAHTDEGRGARRAWTFESVLAEATAQVRRVDVSARIERSTRPDEERADLRFRSYRPLLDFNILGRSRWTTATLNVAREVRVGATARLVPFIEGAVSSVRATTSPSAFEPAAFYGGTRLVTLSIGARLATGSLRHRMGHYGVATVEHR